MSKREVQQQLATARARIAGAMHDIRRAKEYTDNGAHKHLCEAIIMLGDIHKNLSPNDPHLELE